MSAMAATRSPAGFWKRYAAYSIDIVLVYIVVELLTRLCFSGADAASGQLQAMLSALQDQQVLSDGQSTQLAHTANSLWGMVVFSGCAYVAVAGAYFALCESSSWQATLGKRLLGIKVVDVDGMRIGMGRALGRFFAASLSWLSLNVGHAMAGWPPERRALHDYLAGTRVENADPSRPQMPFWGWLIVAANALVFVFAVLAVALFVASILNPVADPF
jgi:hypothetical protein